MKKTLPVIAMAFALGMISCQGETPKLVPYVEPQEAQEKVDLGKEGLVTQLDVIFVVDDSGSMSAHQTRLSNNIDLFTQEFAKSSFVDYHVGIMTSSMTSFGGMCSRACNGVLVGPPKWIERGTPNGIQILKQNFMVGTSGSGSEMFFDPIITGLSSPTVDNENKGFYRPKAHLAIIFVTDAEEQSPSTRVDDFIAFLKKLKGGSLDKVSIYAAYIPSADRSCDRGGEYAPKKFEELFTKTNAITVGLCDPQFGKKLAEVGKDLFRRIARVMYLSRFPDPASIKVYYGNKPLPRDYKKGWTYDPVRNAILFGEQIDWESQPPGSQLTIDYEPAR